MISDDVRKYGGSGARHGPAFPQVRPDFSARGHWIGGAAAPAGEDRGGGLNPPQQLTFTQDADTVTMSWTQDGRKNTETFHLDGSRAKHRRATSREPLGRQTGSSSSSART